MLIPPIRNEDGTTTAAKGVNAYLLPLLQDLQRAAPKPGPTSSLEWALCFNTLGSVHPNEAGMAGVHGAHTLITQ